MICFRSYSLLLLLLLFSGCEWIPKKVDTTKAVPSFVIANVLDKELYDDCHIKGSVNIPFEDLQEYASKHWNKDSTQIIVHCSNYACAASADGYKMLKKLGFNHVWAYEGGTAEAKQEGIAVEGACSEKYLQDYKQPEGYTPHDDVMAISTQDLKKKIEEFAIQ